jgi:hypothetical protein
MAPEWTDGLRLMINAFSGQGIPVFLDDWLMPRLVLEHGNASHPVVICSIPKSGTYFFAALLEALGFVSCRVHIADGCFVDSRFSAIADVRARPERSTYDIPSYRIYPLVLPGQFLVGHLACTAANVSLLSRFRVLFSYRNLRDSMVSYMRYVTNNWLTTREPAEWACLADGPEKMEKFLNTHDYYLRMCAAIAGWKRRPDVLSCCYEEFMGDYGGEVQQERLTELLCFLGLPPRDDLERVLQSVIGRETLTSSGRRTDARAYWSESVERHFHEHGGVKLNRRLGYPEPGYALDEDDLVVWTGHAGKSERFTAAPPEGSVVGTTEAVTISAVEGGMAEHNTASGLLPPEDSEAIEQPPLQSA